MGYFGPYFMILVQPTSKVVFNALKSVTTFDLISYDHQSPYVGRLWSLVRQQECLEQFRNFLGKTNKPGGRAAGRH